MQRQRRAAGVGLLRRVDFQRMIVRRHRGHLGIGDPLQQLLVAAIQPGADLVQGVVIRLALLFQQRIAEFGVEQHDVALLDLDAVGLDDAHQVVVAHRLLLAAIMPGQVDHDAAALQAGFGQLGDVQLLGVGGPALAQIGLGETIVDVIVHRADHVFVGAVAVVVDAFGQAVAVGVEQRAHVRQRVPLGRVLQAHLDDVIAQHVDATRAQAAQREVQVLVAVTLGRAQLGRMAAHVDAVAAGVVQRQRQTEAQALADFLDSLHHVRGSDVIQATPLVIRAEVSPVRSLGTVLPSHVARLLGHELRI
ncbi:Uncharacterised protein [Achromobacter sp. 2789STDY5608621]|nr:Uncharacterised protein [Achromobacter sp. 2789STDY5608621]